MEYIYVATEGDSSDENDIIAPVVSFCRRIPRVTYLSRKLLVAVYMYICLVVCYIIDFLPRYFVFQWSSALPSLTARAVRLTPTLCVGGVLWRTSVLGGQSAGTLASQ